jgi:hypothetical protein
MYINKIFRPKTLFKGSSINKTKKGRMKVVKKGKNGKGKNILNAFATSASIRFFDRVQFLGQNFYSFSFV